MSSVNKVEGCRLKFEDLIEVCLEQKSKGTEKY